MDYFDEEEILLILFGSLIMASSFLFLLVKKRRRNRRYKTRPMNRLKHKYGHYHTLIPFMQKNDNEQFFKYTRMNSEMFEHLLRLVGPHLQKDKKKSIIHPRERLLITLHYLSEGCSQQQLAWDFCIGKATVHKIIIETCDVWWNKLQTIYLKPPTETEFRTIAKAYFKRWNMPNCLGALDGKHVVIQAPKHSGSDYFNYKKTFSIVLMATCDPYYRFTLVEIGAPGASHDATVFSNSVFGSAILNINYNVLSLPKDNKLPGSDVKIPYFFVADQAFPLHEKRMRPYAGTDLEDEKLMFNYRLSRARRTIENTFGILAQRWRILRRTITADVDNCIKFVKATVVLHNYVQTSEMEIPIHLRQYCPTGFADIHKSDGTIEEGRWRAEESLCSVRRVGGNHPAMIYRQSRDMLAKYFISDAGTVPWQYEHIQIGAVPVEG